MRLRPLPRSRLVPRASFLSSLLLLTLPAQALPAQAPVTRAQSVAAALARGARERPLALAVIWGLALATPVTLYALPVLLAAVRGARLPRPRAVAPAAGVAALPPSLTERSPT